MESADFKRIIADLEAELDRARQTIESLSTTNESLNDLVRKRTRELRDMYKNLQITKEKYRGVFQNADDGIFWSTEEGYLINANPAMASILGYDSPSVLLENVSDMIFEICFNPDEGRNILDRILEQKVISRAELRLYRKTGEIIWASVHAWMVYDNAGKPLFIEGTLQDITREKINALERQRLSTVIEQSAECVVLTDIKANIYYVNETFCQLADKLREDVVGRPVQSILPAEVEASFYTGIREALKAKGRWAGKHRIRQEGKNLEMDARVFPIRDEEGQILNYVYLGRDITSQVQMARRLEKAKMTEALGLMAGGISHDFNNILGTLEIYASIVKKNIPEDSGIMPHLDRICQAVEHGRNLIEKILTIGNLSEGERVELDIAQVVEKSIALVMRPEFESIRVTVHNEPEVPRVRGDQSQLIQMMVNLIANAFHAVDKTRGEIEISIKEVTYSIAESKEYRIAPGAYIRIAVRDNGEGMNEEVMERIFDPFFTTRSKKKGTGLGLAMVHGIVSAHKGMILVASEPGLGSAFSVYLPKKADA